MVRAEHADHVEPVVDFMAPAKAAVDRRLGQEPASTPVVQSNAPRRTAAQAQRRVLGDAKWRGQVMQQDQGVPVGGSKLAR